ncbi:MAG: hypothetical protein IKH04_04760 [Kiritimatiellae bacterium]|nr:hypothetical protein [Kiritimatiellia bacterium]
MSFPLSRAESRRFAIAAAAAIPLVLLHGCGRQPSDEPPPESVESEPATDAPAVDLSPVRDFPEKFPRRTHLPDMREAEASGAVSNSMFSAGRDLVYVEDDRVWWESDNDGEDDDECDHSMNKAIVLPFRRLVELCAASNATLRVQECYRPSGIHSTLSLHKEGRALDLTCPMLDPDNPNPEKPTLKSLEILAKLAWAAGFDWVYFEVPRNSGPHIHASVRRADPD